MLFLFGSYIVICFVAWPPATLSPNVTQTFETPRRVCSRRIAGEASLRCTVAYPDPGSKVIGKRREEEEEEEGEEGGEGLVEFIPR